MAHRPMDVDVKSLLALSSVEAVTPRLPPSCVILEVSTRDSWLLMSHSQRLPLCSWRF